MKKQKNNKIYKILLQNKRVNNYTKLLMLLNSLDYYEDYYIPNKKIINILKINKKNTIRLLHQLEEDKMIHVFYKNKKRFFTFTGEPKESTVNVDKIKQSEEYQEIFSYDWLSDFMDERND